MIDEDSVTDDERKVSGQGKKIMSKYSVWADCDLAYWSRKKKTKNRTQKKRRKHINGEERLSANKVYIE